MTFLIERPSSAALAFTLRQMSSSIFLSRYVAILLGGDTGLGFPEFPEQFDSLGDVSVRGPVGFALRLVGHLAQVVHHSVPCFKCQSHVASSDYQYNHDWIIVQGEFAWK